MRKIKRTKLLDRDHDRRDARLFIIATEDKYAGEQYFCGLFASSRVKVRVLATGDDNDSAPEHVIARLDEFQQKYEIGDGDMLWLVVDVDNWGDQKLSRICRAAKQKGYKLGISNPCFEVWLLLHISDLDSQDKTCKDFEKRIRSILGSYNKSNLDLPRYKTNIINAIDRAKALHPDPTQYWPPEIGTHVHRLVEILIQVV